MSQETTTIPEKEIVKELKESNNRVYALIDPLTNKEFYIGITTQENYKNRLYGHIYDSITFQDKNIHKERKIRKIIESGNKPQIIILEEKIKDNKSLKEREKYWISYYRNLHGKNKICNISDGGDFNPMRDLENYEEVIKKLKETKAKLFEEKVLEMGFESIEEYKAYKHEESKHYRRQWVKNHKEHRAKLVRGYRQKKREEMGDEAFKAMIAKAQIDYKKSLSKEEYRKKLDRENEYNKNKRKNESEEERKKRLEYARNYRAILKTKETPEQKELRLEKRRIKRLQKTK